MKMTEKEIEKVLKALANRRRLYIVKFLKKQKEASVGDIAAEIHLSFKATSKHLGVLANAGVIDREQRSSLVYYSLVPGMSEAARRIVSLL